MGLDNEGWEVRWPREDPPAWFQAWAGVSPRFHVEADYVRQAIAGGIHRDSAKLLAAARAAVARAEKVAGAATGIAVQAGGDLNARRAAYIAARFAARAVILRHPALDFDEILFVTQFQAHTKRNITRSFSWKHKPGGDICRLSGFRDGGRVRDLIAGRLGPGFVWGIDLWWAGDRVVFGYARQDNWPPQSRQHHALRLSTEPVHIYEIAVDGTGLRRITDHRLWNDFEPAWCPNGDIVFPSDRKGNAAQCGSFPNDVSNPNLFIVSRDGGAPRRFTDFKDLDRYPHCLDSGLIAFTRWEYQERHFMEVHAIWTTRPDGTMVDALYGHHLPAPCALRDARSVPGTNTLVAVATGHHTFAHGPVVVIDPAKGMNDPAAMRIVTPGVRPQEGGMAGAPVDGGGVPGGGLYRQPWALSADCFLVSYAYDAVKQKIDRCTRALSNGFGIYLVDVHGNKELLYRHPVYSCAYPTPLKKRPLPPVFPATTDPSKNHAVCSTADVCEGTDIAPGTIRYIRIAQHTPWPLDEEKGKMPYLPGNAWQRQYGFWSWSPVRIIGTVPVEKDGSAHFAVPADTAVYFQALDENFMEIRRMRSMVAFKPGEVRGCLGCHETRTRVLPNKPAVALALQRAPSRPAPPAWGDTVLLDYEALIQPILDRRCVRCHGGGKPKGGLDFTPAKDGTPFCRSFRTMFPRKKGKKPLVSVSNRFSDSSVTKPKQFGSHRSRLVLKLLKDRKHRAASKLTGGEWKTLVAWVDANAPYYGSYIDKRPGDGAQPRRVRITMKPPFPE